MALRTVRQRRERPLAKPLDQAALDAIAVRYLERFQTTRARLVRLLVTKVRLRGWVEDAPPPDIEAMADRFVALGYVNDSAFAQARARGLARRGMGHARIRQALSASGVAADDQADAIGAHDPHESAVAFARRKRLGPFGAAPADQKGRQRQFAAMARAGHPPRLIQAILSAPTPADLPEALD